MNLTYTEFILLYKIFKIKGNIRKYLRKKKTTELISENMAFMIMAAIMIVHSLIQEETIPKVPFISIVFSILNSTYTFFINITERWELKYDDYKGYYVYNLSKFSYKTQFFLLDPL